MRPHGFPRLPAPDEHERVHILAIVGDLSGSVEIVAKRCGVTPDVEHAVELGPRRSEIPVAAAEAVRLGQSETLAVSVEVGGDDVGLADDGSARLLVDG